MRVARTRVLEVGAIDAELRAQIEPSLIDIFLRSFCFENTAMFAERVLFRDPDARLTLLEDPRGQIVGFNAFNIQEVESGGQGHAVVHASAYHHPELRGGGGHALRSLVSQILRFKSRRPRVPMCLIGEASTPAGYARVRRHFPLMHPLPGVEIPAAVTALVREVTRLRGFHPLDGDPWRVELGLPLSLRDPTKTRRHAEARAERDPRYAYYLERNPDFVDGRWLLVYVPLNRAQLRAMLAAKLGRGECPC